MRRPCLYSVFKLLVLTYVSKFNSCLKISIYFSSPLNLVGQAFASPAHFSIIYSLPFDYNLRSIPIVSSKEIKDCFSVLARLYLNHMSRNPSIFQNNHLIFINYILKFWTSWYIFFNDWFPMIHVGMITFNIRFCFKFLYNDKRIFIGCETFYIVDWNRSFHDKACVIILFGFWENFFLFKVGRFNKKMYKANIPYHFLFHQLHRRRDIWRQNL